jgi:hypothetical protein
MVLKVMLVLKVIMDHKAPKVIQELRVMLVLKVI